MKKTLVQRYLMLFILGVSLCLPCFAHAFNKHPGQDNPFIEMVITTILGITDDQKAALDELKAETQDAIEPLAEEIKALELPETMLAEVIDTDEAAKKIDKVVEIKSQITGIALNAKLKGAQILTPEQRQLIWTFVGNAIDLLEYIAAYPGWDEIKKFIDEYVKPVLDDICPFRIALDLTDEQKAALEELKTVTKSEIKPLVEDIKALEMPESMLAEVIIVDKVTAKIDSLVEIKSQITAITLNARLEGAQILTPEQRALLLEKIKERK